MLTEYKPIRPLRSLGSSQIEIPRVHTKQGESAFSYYAARSWNQLPEEIRCAKTLATFTVACESLGTPCRICENVNNFNKIREIIQNACYFLFSTVLSKTFYIKYVYI